MQTSDNLYVLGKKTSLRMQIFNIIRVMHCVLIIARASHCAVYSNQPGSIKMSCGSTKGYTSQVHAELVVISCWEIWLAVHLVV